MRFKSICFGLGLVSFLIGCGNDTQTVNKRQVVTADESTAQTTEIQKKEEAKIEQLATDYAIALETRDSQKTQEIQQQLNLLGPDKLELLKTIFSSLVTAGYLSQDEADLVIIAIESYNASQTTGSQTPATPASIAPASTTPASTTPASTSSMETVSPSSEVSSETSSTSSESAGEEASDPVSEEGEFEEAPPTDNNDDDDEEENSVVDNEEDQFEESNPVSEENDTE